MNKSLLIFMLLLVTMLAACGGGGGGGSSGGGPVIPVPGAPSVNVSATSPKVLTFTWTGVAGATHYRLLKNPNGVSGYTQVGADLPNTTTTATDYIGVHLHDWINANYIVQACNSVACINSTAVFTNPAIIAAIGYFKASNTGFDDNFGYAVSLSADGSTLAAGAYREDSNSTGVNTISNENGINSGAVYVFNRTGNIWSQQAYIKASNTGDFDTFGWSLSLSADGATLAVGAVSEDSSTTGINTIPNELASNAGAVYVYNRSGNIWSQQAYIKASNITTGFGQSVSLSADGATLAVGSHAEASSTTGINSTPDMGASFAGAVYVFTRNSDLWSQQAYIKASNTGSNDFFGWSASLSADGSTLAVGAVGEDSSTTGINSTPDENASDAGAVYVFTRNSNIWSQQAYIKPSNTGASDQFGWSLSLSADGATLAVGANVESSSTTGINSTSNEDAFAAGAVYVFNRSSNIWNQQAYIKASNTAAGDHFGVSVSLPADGATLAVGAFGDDSSTTGINSTPNNNQSFESGAVHLFTRSGSIWSQKAYIKAPTNPAAGDYFGMSVSLSGDGDTLAVGANGENSSTTGINSTDNDAPADAGAVYLY